MENIRIVKPEIWNFEIVKGKDSWKEVVYSARISGVPEHIDGKDVFKMLIENDYGSALEHIIIKFDLKMSKGNAPEFLEHRIMSHTGYSTRYIDVSEGIDKKEPVYEIIVPYHLLKGEINKVDKIYKLMDDCIRNAIKTYKDVTDKGIPREIARYVLPFAQAVGIYHVTINLRSLINLLSLRLCVRSSPEFRCIASQLYFSLMRELPEIKGLIGCRGFMRGLCPESNVTGVRVGEQHPFYPPCPFKSQNTDIFIPTIKELRRGLKLKKFNKERAVMVGENNFNKWMKWG